ncbi:MAG: DUF4340 domain-containing protein [Planctomycetota bacterium]
MNIRPTIIVFVLAVISVTGAMLFDRQQRTAGAATDLATVQLLPTDFSVDDVDVIELQRGDGTPMVFTRDGTGWWQTEPFRFPMDPFSIRQLAVIARELAVRDVIEIKNDDASTSRAALRLEPPAATLTLRAGERAITLNLGRRGVAGRAYLQRDGESTVCVVDAALHDRAIDMDPREWRNRTIFRDVDVECESIERTQGDVRLVLQRQTRRWDMMQPVATRVDADAIEAFLSDIARAELANFVIDQPDDLADFGLAVPVARLDVRSTQSRVTDEGTTRVPVTQTLLIGAQAAAGTNDRFAMIEGQPVIFRLPATAIVQIFLLPPEYLIDATGSGVAASDVKSFVVRHPAGEFRVTRDLEDWKTEVDGEILTLPYAYVEELLSNLTTLRAPRLEVSPYPRDLERAMVTLYGFDRRPLDTIRIVHDPTSDEWKLENGDNVLRVIADDVEWRLTLADYGVGEPLKPTP